jgi:hypothetical protein
MVWGFVMQFLGSLHIMGSSRVKRLTILVCVICGALDLRSLFFSVINYLVEIFGSAPPMKIIIVLFFF